MEYNKWHGTTHAEEKATYEFEIYQLNKHHASN